MKFCERQQLLKQYGQIYSKFEGAKTQECWYCKQPKECVDHCPPLSSLSFLDVHKFREHGGNFVLIPSCMSCNSLLGERKLFTPNERISWLLGAYNKLFDKSYYGWSDEEVREMGFVFRTMINASRLKSNSYIDRIKSIEKTIVGIENWGLTYSTRNEDTLASFIDAREKLRQTKLDKVRAKELATENKNTLKIRKANWIPVVGIFYAICNKDGLYYRGASGHTIFSNCGLLEDAKLIKGKRQAENTFKRNKWPTNCKLVEVSVTKLGRSVAT